MSLESSPCHWRVLEFFAGIGGLAAAWPAANVVAAIDINRHAEATYRRNHPHPFLVREIEALGDAELQSWNANCWWLSPPCQPYSRRGHQHDLQDPRARPLLRLIEAIQVCRPGAIAVENVVGFESSHACEQLRHTLHTAGYHLAELTLCPSQLQWPNRRPRVYLLASLRPLRPWQPLLQYQQSLAGLIEQDISLEHSTLWLDDALASRYATALDRVDPRQTTAVTACFAGSYGKTLLRSGSYLFDRGRYRRFSPREVARLMGFPNAFQLADLPDRTAWKLLGNSLSLPAVRYVLAHLPAC